ncbi:MAG TPA: hypothetical protein P5193_02210 [Microthrixaceae bacterium]|nr:hypothetical protein [Microthrixaceae bacterium]
MSTLDDLRADLVRLAERGEHRPAAEVYREAVLGEAPAVAPPRPRGHRPVRLATAIGLTAAIVVAVAVVAGRTTRDAGPRPLRTHDAATTLVPAIDIAGPDAVRQVTVAFGQVWVATLDEASNTTTVQGFDAGTGLARSTVRTEGPGEGALIGDAFPLVATEHSLWIRTSTNGPALPEHGGADNLVYEVDPASGTATVRSELHGDGQLVGHGDAVAAVDFTHIEVIEEGGAVRWSRTTDEVVGIDDATAPGTNGLGWARLDDDSAFVTHEGHEMVVRLDATSGAVQGRADLDDSSAPMPSDPSPWWIRTRPAARELLGAVPEGDGVRVVRVPALGERNLIATIDRDHVLLDRPYAVYDLAHRSLRSLDVPEDEIAALVRVGSVPWLARWGAPAGGRSTVRFAPIALDSEQIVGTFADGQPWSVLRDPAHGLCVVLAESSLGCDDVGPVVPADADPSTVRWGLDADRWLAYGELPGDAVDVVVTPPPGRPAGGAPVVDRRAGLWAVAGDDPDEVFDPGEGYAVHYRLADGRLVEAPRPR